MQTVLFNSTIFGPIHSRRLGASLGVNLSPSDGKVCSFDCLYCEAGFNAQGAGTSGLPTREQVRTQLREKLAAMRAEGAPLNVITFSGNGEPTLHPDFEGIVDDTIALRNEFYPEVKISVLTNSTRLDSEAVCRALRKVDNNILKLDSAIEATMRRIDRPTSRQFTAERVIGQLKQFSGSGIIQTMLLRGDGIDNTTEAEISALIKAYKEIQPRQIMLYSIDRKTPDELLRAVGRDELLAIADRIARETALDVTVA
ncbi:MAG: radical SAM protein [Bacteroides sp.]|nr:radical SAM protein [Bacteroides sp.]MCM1379713.1 radical SAM protein [Bacteroides sp.]MCM1446068.1 radical SAM protein [Prevotella sp.]